MARENSDREDLLREATALSERIELRVPAASEGDDRTVVIGFRTSGGGAVFFDAEPVYQFNSACELRRAYQQGMLFKAEKGRLVRLQRQRESGQVLLLRSVLPPEDQESFVAEMLSELRQLREQIHSGSFAVRGQVPETGDLLPRVRQWLDVLLEGVAIAAVPNAG